MNFDPAMFIGLIGASCVAGALGLSLLGAYLLGHSRGRREAQLEERDAAVYAAQRGDADRLRSVEGAVSSMSESLARMLEAQRTGYERGLLSGQAEPRPLSASIRRHDTPA